MSAGTPYNVLSATYTSTATSASDTITTNTTVPLGDTLILHVSVRLNVNLTLTGGNVTNNGSLALSPDVIAIPNGGQNGNTWEVRIFASVAIPSGTSFTLTYTGGSPTRHEISAFGCSGLADQTPDANHIGTASGTNTAPTATTAGSTPATGDLAVGIWNHVGAGANGETGTPSTNFTEFQDGPPVGAASPFMHQYVEYDVLGAGGAVTSAPTFASNSGGWLGGVIVYVQSASGITLNAPLATGAGTAFVPSGSMTVDSTPLAAGAGTAFVPAAALRGDAPEALGAGTAFVPAGSMTATAPEATGAGTAFAPSAAMVANAPEAHGAGQAFPASGNVSGPIYHRTFWRHPFVFPWSDKGGLSP